MDEALTDEDRHALRLSRVALHASELEIESTHLSSSTHAIQISAPLPSDIEGSFRSH